MSRLSRTQALAYFFREQFAGDRQRAARWLLAAAKRWHALGNSTRAVDYARAAEILLSERPEKDLTPSF